MNILNGLQNLLQFINDNWGIFVLLISIIVSIVVKIREFLSQNTDKQVEIVKNQLSEIMLKLITDAEKDYADWGKSGDIKRSQVIKNIFTLYPILGKVIDQAELIAWIDEQINVSLKTLREIVVLNKEAI